MNHVTQLSLAQGLYGRLNTCQLSDALNNFFGVFFIARRPKIFIPGAPQGGFAQELRHTPNANMADHSVVARDELHESEASWALAVLF